MHKKALSVTFVGILIGVTVAVLLARHGVWPPDQLTLFLLSAVTGLAGFGFVRIVGDGLDVVAVIAWSVMALLLGILGILFFPGRRVVRTASDEAIERSESVDVADKLKVYEAGSRDLFEGDDTA